MDDLKVIALQRKMGEVMVYHVDKPCTFFVLVDRGAASGIKVVTIAPPEVAVQRGELCPDIVAEMKQAVQLRSAS
jgi:sRNA-binding carbon storage regulator CsrA